MFGNFIEFLKNFFREGTQESSTRLVLIISAMSANLICLASTAMYFYTSKDYSSQAALLSGLLLGVASSAKVISKGKEAPTQKE